MIKEKKYPDWAPKKMVDSLEARRRIDQIMTKTMQNKVVDYMLEHSTNIEACSEEQKQELRARYHGNFVLFPLKEQIGILEKLLTNPEMERVWIRISEEVKDDYEYEKFWQVCLEAVAGGRRIYQRTETQHKKHFQKIKKYALELSRSLEETDEMIYFPTTRLISDDKIEQLRTNLLIPSEKNVQHIRSYLDGVIPDIQAILHNCALKAEEISEIKPLAKKVNSRKGENTKRADVQYFVRYLSRYLREIYSKPFHEFVAAITRIVFDDINIDAEYVRQLNR